MKTDCLPFVLAVLLFSFAACDDDTSCSCPAVPEQPLAEIARTHTATFGGATISSLKITCYYSSHSDTLYDAILQETDKGTKRIIDGSVNPDFDNAAELLTNGDDDPLQIILTLTNGFILTGGSSRESLALQGGYSGEYYPDLAGADVTRIFLYVDNIWFDHSEPPNTTYHIMYRVVIMGRP